MITILHQYNPSIPPIGGINSWIADYLYFATKKTRILGVVFPGTDRKEMFIGKLEHEFIPIAEIKSKRKLIPDSLFMARGLFQNKKFITESVIVHRIDFVPLIKLISPQSRIALFIHTDSIKALNKQSDSKWKHLKWLYKIVEKVALKLADKVTVYSESDIIRLKEIKPEVQLGLSWYNDEIFFNKSADDPRNIILWVGRFESPKNPVLAVRIFSYLIPLFPDLEFIMVGHGSLDSDVKKEIIRLSLESRLKLIQPMPQQELATLLGRTKVLLQTSIFEGAPRILIEAIACGVFVVSTATGDPENWTINDKVGKRIHDNLSPKDMADQIKSIIASSELHNYLDISNRSASKRVLEIENELR